ncbi:MAG: hypothetical protein JSS35_14195, partial [Proteobacteria bacterium]|nr:hypothetical protein [Pseudomonadota bacterium]
MAILVRRRLKMSGAPVSELNASIAAIQAHPRFVAAVRETCKANLAFYRGAALSERWLLKDGYAVSLMLIALMGDAL